MTTFALLLGLLGCGEPDRFARLDEVLPEGALPVEDRAALDGDVVVAVLSPEGAWLTAIGDFEDRYDVFGDDGFVSRQLALRELREETAALRETAIFEVRDGRFTDEDLRGQLHAPMYDALLARAEILKDLGYRCGREEHQFDGRLVVLVHREVPFRTFTQLLFTAGQSQLGNLELVLFGPSEAGPKPGGDEFMAPPDALTRTAGPLSRRERVSEPGDLTFEVDDSEATFEVRAGEEEGQLVHTGLADGETPVGAVFPDPANPYLYPSFAAAAEAAQHPVLPSLEMLLHVSKQADDRLMAAIERDRTPARDAWVADALAAIDAAKDPEAAAWLAAAALLAGVDAADLPPATLVKAQALVEDFDADPRASRPVGIYGEDEVLARVFRRDRWLAQELDGEEAEHVAVAGGLRGLLEREADLRRRHDEVLALQARLTNPPGGVSLVDVPSDQLPREFHFLAPARSPETELVKKRGGTRNIPEGPMQALVDAVRSGEVDLRPTDEDGWYAHQLWALEPLLRFAEPAKLTFDQGYAGRLERAFKAAVAMRRETQIKSLQLPAIGAPAPPPVVVDVAPDLRVEPLPTHFERSAESYAFLEARVLDDQLGERWRGWEDGGVAEDLGRVSDRYRAAAALSRADLGLAYADDAEPAVADTAAWLEGWSQDPALAADVRFMIPFGESPGGETLAWAVLGVRAVDIEVAYVEPPEVVLSDASLEVAVRTHPRPYTLLVPVFEEVEVGAILARERFRELADAHPFQRDLVRALAELPAAP